MKLLLVGFEPATDIQYPHLRQVADYLRAAGADYCYFRERGYFLGEASPGPLLHRLRRSLSTLLSFSIDSLRLLAHRRRRYDAVIAVDNVAYLVAARLFPVVVLWSHDFLTVDELRSQVPLQRLIRRLVTASLLHHRRLIIQDDPRQQLFLETYLGASAVPEFRTFFLPVSLREVAKGEAASAPANPPRLMQIGGINAWRSRSDALLDHYQQHAGGYRLCFHGFLDPTMMARLAAAPVQPDVSARPIPPDEVHRVVERCDIGFVAYNAANLNFFHVARASGQLAEFLRCGKPVITLGQSSLGQLLETERLGRHIADINALQPAIDSILADYSGYAARCRAVYLETYDLGRYLPELLEWLRPPGGPN